MSTDKPKRPSARPSARPSSPPPPPTEVRVEPAAEDPGATSAEPAATSAEPAATSAVSGAAGPTARPPRFDRKARISARRGTTTGEVKIVEPAKVERTPEPRAAASKAQGSKPKVAAVRKPPAKVAAPRPADSARGETPPVEPKEVAAPGTAFASLVEPSVAAEPAVRADSEPPEADDDDIWNESDAGAPAVMTQVGDADDEPAAPRAPGASRLARSRREGRRDEAVRLGSAETLVSTDYYFRQYGAHGMRSLSAEVDEFGLDPHVEERARPWLEGLCKRYFRVDVDGAQNLPAEGRVLMVGNRAGALPWDGLVLRTAIRMARPNLQPVRWLAEDSVFHYPFLGVFMNRLGAVRACPENAERLLRQDRLVAVFPEGAHGSGKLFKDRYRLQRFGRGGYVKLALKLGAPIVPTAIIGSEETNPVLARSRLLGRVLGGESLPITPTFPWLGAAGLLPAPVKWRIVVGEPIDLSAYGPQSADDALVVHRLNEQIRGILQTLVEQALGSRRSVLFG